MRKVYGPYEIKVTVLTSGEAVWSPIPGYVWKRNPRTKINFFDLITVRGGKSHILSKSWFFRREPTFSELMKSVASTFDMEKVAEMMLSRFQPILSRRNNDGEISRLVQH